MRFREYDQNQIHFTFLNYRQMLGEDSLPVLINDIVDKLDISRFEERYGEVGNIAYHPRLMCKVIIYGYTTGAYGGRPIYNRFTTDLGLRFLCNDDLPDHRTLNRFRINFKDEIADIFSQVVMLCTRLGMIGFENLAIDGHKIKANANVFQNKNLKGINNERDRIRIQLRNLLDEDLSFDNGINNIKKEEKLIRRMNKLNEAVELLKSAGGEDNPEMRYNLTDPDSRKMVDKRGVTNPFYNCQNAVDDEYGIITGVDVTNVVNDNGELFSMKEKSKENTGKVHTNTLADCGYADKENYDKMEVDTETEYYIPDRTMHSSRDDPYNKWHFHYKEEKDQYICPRGKPMVFVRESKDSKGMTFRIYKGVECKSCEYKDECMGKKKKKGGKNKGKNEVTQKKNGYRTISIYPQDNLIKAMRSKLDSCEGKAIYQRRMETVEPLQGDIQKNRGFLQFSLRGLDRVQVEYNLVAIASNIRKIFIHGKFDPELA